MSEQRVFRDKEPGLSLVRQQIALNGPMNFERFMDLALYHPAHGYYHRAAPQRGRSGDYFTSMQVGGLFPRLFADALRAMRETLGPEQFSLVELGAGDGDFLETLLTTLSPDDRRGLRVWAVERSRSARENLWRRLSRFPKCEVVATIDDIDWMGGLEGCVFSNEFFDALPFHRLRRRGHAWREMYVDVKDGALVDLEGNLSDPSLPALCGLDNADVPDGNEVEARPAIRSLYEDIAGRLSRGYMVTVDYGHPRSALLREDRARGTWRCFYQHALSENVYAHVGRQDITADVDFTQLADIGRTLDFAPALFSTQGIFLTHVAKDTLERSLAADPSLARGVQQLLHPGAMGERFSVLVQTKTAELPPTFAAVPNRLRRLDASLTKI